MISLSKKDIINEKQEEIKHQLSQRVYGEIPPKPLHLTYKIQCSDPSFAAGKATKNCYNIILDFGEKKIILPITSVIPNCGDNFPAIINLTAEERVPNKYLPAEELIYRGYAIFSLCMKDVANNDSDFKSAISGHIARSRRKKNAPGKLAVWAWAILRTIDYVSDLNYIDKNAIAVAGHGICARAAMLAAGFDQRVGFIIANGIVSSPIPYSSSNRRSGMTVHDYPYLYCPAFADKPFGDEYAGLLSLCAPRCLLIGSASDGIGLYNEVEYDYLMRLSDEFYHSIGLKGLGEKRIIPTANVCVCGDEISYHIRPGVDYFSREDWNIYLDFIDQKNKQKQSFDNFALHIN